MTAERDNLGSEMNIGVEGWAAKHKSTREKRRSLSFLLVRLGHFSVVVMLETPTEKRCFLILPRALLIMFRQNLWRSPEIHNLNMKTPPNAGGSISVKAASPIFVRQLIARCFFSAVF
jgi:hypothetical protein